MFLLAWNWINYMDAKLSEYCWASDRAECSHKYLLSPIEKSLIRFSRHTNQANLRIFDAGCGNGSIAGKLMERGHSVSGCDISEKGISLARQHYPAGRFEVASVYDDLTNIFGCGWDVVISSEVIEHLYYPRLFTKNIASLLHPGGLLVITTPYHSYLKNLALSLAGAMDNHFTALWDGGHVKFWSYKTLRTLLAESGFKQFHFSGAGRVPFLWKSMVVSAIYKQV